MIVRRGLGGGGPPGHEQAADNEPVDEAGWTREESQVQRALSLIRGVRLNNTQVPQNMPPQRLGAPMYGGHLERYLDGPGRHRDEVHGNDLNQPENKDSIKELTEVFKPLRQTEYLKS